MLCQKASNTQKRSSLHKAWFKQKLMLSTKLSSITSSFSIVWFPLFLFLGLTLTNCASCICFCIPILIQAASSFSLSFLLFFLLVANEIVHSTGGGNLFLLSGMGGGGVRESHLYFLYVWNEGTDLIDSEEAGVVQYKTHFLRFQLTSSNKYLLRTHKGNFSVL